MSQPTDWVWDWGWTEPDNGVWIVAGSGGMFRVYSKPAAIGATNILNAAASRLAELQAEHIKDIDFLHEKHDAESALTYGQIWDLNKQVQALQAERDAAIKVADRNAEVAADLMTELDAARAEGLRLQREIEGVVSLEKAVREELTEVEAENATLRERAALMEKALGLWMVEAEIGYRRHGVGVGSVLLRKYPADEAKFWTRTALAATSPAVEVVAPEGGGT